MTTPGPVRRLLGMLRPHAGRLVLAIGASVLAELSTLALMAVAAWLIARAAQQPPLVTLSLAIVGVRAFATFRGAFRYTERLASHDVALRALATLRGRVYDALVPLAPSGLPAYRSADLLSRMVHDVEAVQDFVVRVLVPVTTAVLVGGLATGFTTAVLPVAGVAVGGGLVLAGVALPVMTAAAARRAARRLAPARAELAARTTDLIQGSADLAVLGAVDEAVAAADDAAAQLARVERGTAHTGAVAGAVGMLLQGATTVVVAVLALSASEHGSLAPVMVPVVALTALIAFEPVLPLTAAVQRLLESRGAIRRVLDVINMPAPVREPSAGRAVPARVVLETRGLRVRYPGAARDAVAGVDLRLEPGRRLAVVGPSGSGKSTLLACLMRFIEPTAGQVLLGGHDTREYASDDVRAVVTGVTQDAHLFHTSIRENLRLARPGADDDELFGALETARLRDWVESLPRGLDTVVGEAGAQLSGGQRQRLALARVLLADPAVMLLDEPTEGLDPETADELVADLVTSTQGRAVVLVTHRLAGLDRMDEIVVMRDGRIVQRGKHDELVVEPGPYRDLWWASAGAAEGASADA